VAKSSSTGARPSRSLVYGLNLLKLFTAEHPVRGIAELAEQMDVSRPTAHRYATTCLELGYLEQAPMRRYRLARRAAAPGAAMIGSLQLTRQARPLLRELREATGRTASLAILDGVNVLYLLRMVGFERGQYELERGLGTGSRRPAQQTAAGQALHAALEHSTAERLAPVEFAASSEGARIDARELALAVIAPGFKTSAIELVAPADVERAELLAELEEPLRVAARSLRASLLREATRERLLGESCS
jgi:IclR family transcriptional regulator, pca regulon regulatory protein